MQLLRVLEVYGLIASKDGVIDHVVQLLKKEEEDIKKIAQRLAEKLVDKVPILYSDSDCEGVAVRWRQQLNENAKILCWHHALPEMNHNELVGWAGAKDDVAVVVLRNETDHPRTALRMDISKKIITRYNDNYTELLAKGVSSLERTMYLINIGDWVSVYLAELRKVDPVEVNVIDFLKGSLAGQNA